MWLFTGRYAHYGVAICIVALGFASVAILFALTAGRLALRGEGRSGRDARSNSIVWGLIVLAAAAAFGEIAGFEEPVFVPGYGLNRGDALILSVLATLLGIGALVLPRNLRRWRVLLLLGASGVLLGDVAGWLRRSAQPSTYFPNYKGKLFRLDDGIWTPAPPFTDHAQFALSKRGVLWTLDLSGQLSSLDGEHWTHFGRTGFGEPTDRLAGMHHLALRDEEVWKATALGVASFNGKSWRLYENVLKTYWPVDMAVGRSGVWIVDFYGNLSHFDGENWTVENLKTIASAPPPQGWDYWLDADQPARLTMTGDGRLWILWHGLWRREGEAWGEIRVPGLNLTRALLIGHDEDSVWLRSEDAEIVSITADGVVRARHSWREMGLSRTPEIRSLAVADGRIWVASSGGLFVLDGERWRNLGHPLDYYWIVDVAVAPHGSAWVVGVKEVP
jgi:hypothetical protein